MTDKIFAIFPDSNNKKIVSELESAGVKLIKFPLIQTEKVILDEVSIQTIKNLANFDWIIYPDVLAVDFFLEALDENEIDLFDLDEMRVCALGEAVSDRLRFVQLHADVIPDTIEPENVASALRSYTTDDELRKLKFLIPKEISSEVEIKKELSKTKAEFFELPIYQIQITENNEISKLKALLKGGAIDEFIFSSQTDFIALKYIFNNEPLERIFAEINVSAIDGLVFQTIREHNLKCSGLFQPNKIAKV